MKELWLRWKEPLNKFWARVRNIMAALLVSSGSVLAVIGVNGWGDDPKLATLIMICKYVAIVCASVGVTAQFTKK